MSKKKPLRPLRATAKFKADVLKTLENQFKVMSIDERKAILKKIGVTKKEIETLDERGLIRKLNDKFSAEIDKFDFNNPSVDPKFKKGAEFISRKNKKDLKTEIINYKNS